ncbi:MAG: class I SAM-dependent methyltransferase [Hyphomicrobiaceae bacterium]|nr:class I SAM-dependent methyltransferase [Hyphomicrobiaceae bacterium]
MTTPNMPELPPSPASPPSAWVERFLTGVAAGGRALDVACGQGRHLRLALALGLSVTGIDRTLAGVADLRGEPRARLIAADLESGGAFPVGEETFEVVIVTNYLWRPLLPRIVAAVAPGGLLIYETFAVGNERFGRPANPEFLLRPNELLEAALPRLVVVAYEHREVSEPRARIVQRIAAVGRDHPWATP